MDTKPGAGLWVSLWTHSDPPLFVGIFDVIEIPNEWADNPYADMALSGTISHYTEKALERMVRGMDWLRISWQINDKYNPESFTRYVYTPVVYEVNSGLLMRDEEGPRSLLLLLQEYPIESSVGVEQLS